MTKLHRCPECGRSHTGLTLICGDCLYEQLLEHEKRDGGPLPEGAIVTVDPDDEGVTKFLTGEPNNVTPVTKRRGRPRVHKDNAERQKAWRGRHG